MVQKIMSRGIGSFYHGWNFVDSPDEPHVIPPITGKNGKDFVPDRFVVVGDRGNNGIFSDLYSLSTENGKYLRRYTYQVTAEAVFRTQPGTAAEISTCFNIQLTDHMSTGLRQVVSDVIGWHSSSSIFARIGREPEVINMLWKHELFAHVLMFSWKGDVCFGRSLFRNQIMYVMRDTSIITAVSCPQDPSMTIDNACFVGKTRRRIWID